MPSASDGFRWLPALTIAVLAWLTLFPVVSVDAHYHLATGRRMLDDGAIPTRGVGSATFGSVPWHDNEWGFQLLVAAVADYQKDDSGVWVLSRPGVTALIVLRALCLAATLALIAGQMRMGGVGALTRSVALTLAAFLTYGNLFWAIRPQILSYLALAAVAWLLEADRCGRRWAVWSIPAVIALWSNVHGAFVIGIALIATEVLGESLDAWRGRAEWTRARRVAWSTLICVAAGCLNPHGYRQLLHPFLYLLRPEIHRGNVEWDRPDFLHLPLFVLTLALLVVALAARGRVRAADALRCLAFTVLMFTAIRHLPLAAIVLTPILAASVSAAARRGGWRSNLEPTGPGWGGPATRAVAALMLVGGIVALSGAFTRSGARFVTLWPRFEFRPVGVMPEEGARLYRRLGVGGTIFNAYRFGGFLMFRLYPDEPVFMDGRNDLYGTFRDEVYNPILEARPGWRARWRESLERFDVRWVMIDESDALADRLLEGGGWLRPAGVSSDRDTAGGGVVTLLRDTADHRATLGAARRANAGNDEK